MSYDKYNGCGGGDGADLVVADEVYEKVDEALEILWWKPKNWTVLKIVRLLRKLVWYMFVCLSTTPENQKCQKSEEREDL